MISIFKLLSCMALFVLAACSSYHARNIMGVGFSEIPLAKDTYKITFAGDEGDSRDEVYDHFLHRCAEIGMQLQKPFFVIESADQSSYTHNRGTTSYTDVDVYGDGFSHNLAGATSFHHGTAKATAQTHTFEDKYQTYDYVGVVHFYAAQQKPQNALDGNLIMQKFAQDQK